MTTSNLHIMMIVLNLDMGGLERMVIQLIQGLLKRDVHITLVCLEHEGSLAHQLDQDNIDIITLDKSPGLRFGLAWTIANLVRSLQVDVIHSHNSGPHFYAGLAAALLFNRVKLIHTKHGRDDPDNTKKVVLNRISSFFTHTIVAVSNDASDVCRDIEGIHSKKLAVIENGIDLSPFVPIDRSAQAQRIHSGEIRLMHTGRLSQEKNQQLLLHVFALVIDTYPKAKLTICGDGNEKSNLVALATSLGIIASINFTGAVNDVPRRIADHDVFVLTSVTEGLPLAIIEAMAGGLPVVSTDVGGMREVINNGENGYVVPSQDRHAILNALLTLFADLNHLQAAGDNAKAMIHANYSLNAMVDQYLTLYQSVAR